MVSFVHYAKLWKDKAYDNPFLTNLLLNINMIVAIFYKTKLIIYGDKYETR